MNEKLDYASFVEFNNFRLCCLPSLVYMVVSWEVLKIINWVYIIRNNFFLCVVAAILFVLLISLDCHTDSQVHEFICELDKQKKNKKKTEKILENGANCQFFDRSCDYIHIRFNCHRRQSVAIVIYSVMFIKRTTSLIHINWHKKKKSVQHCLDLLFLFCMWFRFCFIIYNQLRQRLQWFMQIQTDSTRSFSYFFSHLLFLIHFACIFFNRHSYFFDGAARYVLQIIFDGGFFRVIEIVIQWNGNNVYLSIQSMKNSIVFFFCCYCNDLTFLNQSILKSWMNCGKMKICF